MEKHETLLMKSLAMALKEGGDSGRQTVMMTARAAGEFGVLILQALDELQCERDSVAAYRVSCAALERERDSLRERYEKDNSFLVDELGKATAEFNQVRAERDSLKKDVAHLMTDRDVMRDECNRAASQRDSIKERYEREMASFKGGNARLASLLDASLKERDSLKRKVESFTPIIVEFASELRDKAQGLIDKASQASGGGVA